MAACHTCGSTILIGGKRDGDLRYCNDKCLRAGVLLEAAELVPVGDAERRARAVHAGLCPRCKGAGPVDVRSSFRVWSALIMTSWSRRDHVVCRSCALKSQLGDSAYCAVLGWWGFPWGFIMTPIMLGKNVLAMIRSPDPGEPSEQLVLRTRLHLAAGLAGAPELVDEEA